MTSTDTTTYPAATDSADNGVDVEALLGARQALTDAPPAAAFVWKATSEWVNGTHTRTSVDGFFGPQTLAILTAWQQAQSLPADGVWNLDDAVLHSIEIEGDGEGNQVLTRDPDQDGPTYESATRHECMLKLSATTTVRA